MLRSMTGFGRAEARLPYGIVTIEIKSFNHRYFEFAGRIPTDLLMYEGKIKDYLQKNIRRGAINITINFSKELVDEKSLRIDQKLAKKYRILAKELIKTFGVKDDLGVRDFFNLPGVIVYEQERTKIELPWAKLRPILEEAYRDLTAMKEREGKELLKDFLNRIYLIRRSLNKISQRTKKATFEYKKRLGKKLKEILNTEADPEKIEQEVILFARNSDISEEITRMKSHLQNAHRLLLHEEEIGRRLDFIAQELYREANTISAKASDYQISKEIVEIKSQIEKIREQAQNVE